MANRRGDFINMLRTILVLLSIAAFVQGSGIEHGAHLVPAPVVTAASSQYFERTFNRLVAGPPPVLQPVFPVAPEQPVFVEPTVKTTGPTANRVPILPAQNAPIEPNIAIAIATAQAAPVATILLPPYPFGPPPTFGFIPLGQPPSPNDEPKKEPTTPQPTTQIDVQTTVNEPEQTTPLPSGSDNNFIQAQPSNENGNSDQYYIPPPQRPQGNEQNFNPQPSDQNVNSYNYAPPNRVPTQLFQNNNQQSNGWSANKNGNFHENNQNFNPQSSYQNVNLDNYAPPRPILTPLPQINNQQSNSWSENGNGNFVNNGQNFNTQPSYQNVNLNSYGSPSPIATSLTQINSQRSNGWSSNENANFHQQYAPSQIQQPHLKPQKYKTTVEVVPVPLAYIAPPPPRHEYIKIKHIHTYVPAPTKIVIRPISKSYGPPIKIRTVRVPEKLIVHKTPSFHQKSASKYVSSALRKSINTRDVEPITPRPFFRTNTKPPRV